MNKINIKILSEDALNYLKKNISTITKKVQENQTNEWIFKEFPQPMFINKKFEVEDFELEDNPESKNKKVDFCNSIKIYESLNKLPRYILSDQRFWLWLHLDKFYSVARLMMKINGEQTIKDHWMHSGGNRRGLMFGVLSRCYFRVALSIDESAIDKYELTKWIIENPLRFRNLTWRSFSSEQHLVRGALKGEKRAVEENPKLENNDYYPVIALYIQLIGSVRLLDVISEDDIAAMVYKKMSELMNGVSE